MTDESKPMGASTLSKKERMAILRHGMPEQDALAEREACRVPAMAAALVRVEESAEGAAR